jgi:hypothetical protein
MFFFFHEPFFFHYFKHSQPIMYANFIVRLGIENLGPKPLELNKGSSRRRSLFRTRSSSQMRH